MIRKELGNSQNTRKTNLHLYCHVASPRMLNRNKSPGYYCDLHNSYIHIIIIVILCYSMPDP